MSCEAYVEPCPIFLLWSWNWRQWNFWPMPFLRDLERHESNGSEPPQLQVSDERSILVRRALAALAARRYHYHVNCWAPCERTTVIGIKRRHQIGTLEVCSANVVFVLPVPTPTPPLVLSVCFVYFKSRHLFTSVPFCIIVFFLFASLLQSMLHFGCR